MRSIRRGLICFGLLALALGIGAARAQSSSGAGGTPNAQSEPLRPAASPPTASCPDRPDPVLGGTSAVVPELVAETFWRPRGAEVRFTIKSAGSSPLAIDHVRVCFGWSSPDTTVSADRLHALVGSPLVHAISNASLGVPTYGALVPGLPAVPQQWWSRLIGPNLTEYTGLYAVPVADMVVEVTPVNGKPVTVVLPVGVTNVPYAVVLSLACLALFCFAAATLARHRGIRGGDFVLRLISTRDGYASLSQFQIMLWTIVVGLAAVYVMTLSGNLIPITSGTLVLLGIASAAALLARVPTDGNKPVIPASAAAAAPAQSAQPATTVGATPATAVPAATPAASVVTGADTGVYADGVAPAPREPRWSDLVVTDGTANEIDVTRVQMLVFTLVTAAFVGLKVIVSYEIPEIPENFQLLMGISNGVYVGGRHLPTPGKAQAPAKPTDNG